MVASEYTQSDRNWKVESFRATTFHNGFHVNAQDVADIWERVAQGKPEQVSSRPREGLILAEGTYNDNWLVCNCRPDRVDWNLGPVPPLPNVPIEGFITMGPFLEHYSSLITVANNWLTESPPVIRLAFGSVLVLEISDLPAGYEELNSLLPKIELDSTGSSDFFYQINRRRLSTSSDQISINRLSKWSVMQAGSVGIAVSPNVMPQFLQGSDYFACRLELDINTAGALANPIAQQEAIEVFSELMNLGKEIAQRGDIA